MLFTLKSLFRPSTQVNSTGTVSNNSSPSTPLIIIADEFPFPTNPTRVKKARHNNPPKYLPRADASVRDIQYFLYNLLTSKSNDCAKRYPEWVLETCMGWGEDSGQFHNCTQEQLETLCPITAVAIGIGSHKHKPGAFVPIPARHMIGEAIAQFVLEKREGENQPHTIHRRLQEERSRSCSDKRAPIASEAVQDAGASRTMPQASGPLSRSRSMNLPKMLNEAALKFATPSMWMAPAYRRRDNIPPFPIPTALSTESTSNNLPSVPDSPSQTNLVTSSGPASSNPSEPFDMADDVPPTSTLRDTHHSKDTGSSSRSSPHTMAALSTSESFSAPTPGVPSNDEKQHPIQLRQDSSTSWPLSSHPASGGNTKAEVSQFHLPLRQAPGRSSTLEASISTSNKPFKYASYTMPPPRNCRYDVLNRGVGTLADSISSVLPRRRSSLALRPKSTIPEEIAEELIENSTCQDGAHETPRHDSGVDKAFDNQGALSNSSPALLAPVGQTAVHAEHSETSSDSSPVASLNDPAHNVWSAPRPRTISPAVSAIEPPVRSGLRRSASAAPFVSRSSIPAINNSIDALVRTSMTDRNRDGFCGEQLAMSSGGALEAHYQNVEQLRGITSVRNPHCEPRFQKANSNNTFYSAPGSMQHTNSNSLHALPMSPTSFMQQQSFATRTRHPTLIEVIEERERQAKKPLNIHTALIGRHRSMPRLGVDN
jgi:hypothetical protein